MRKTVSILGTEYEIVKKKYSEEPAFEKREIGGYCDRMLNQLVYCDMSTYKGWEDESAESCQNQEKLTLRHEIVHAFLYESGLADNTMQYDGVWAQNEEMVDWIALQGIKIYAAWKEAGAI